MFDYLTLDCKDETTYIKWECTQTKKVFVIRLRENGKDSNRVLAVDDEKTTVSMQHFETVEKVTKKSKITNRLVAKSSLANVPFILDCISKCLHKIINHRNHLKSTEVPLTDLGSISMLFHWISIFHRIYRYLLNLGHNPCTGLMNK